MVTCSRLLKFQPTQESDSESDKRRVQILCKTVKRGWNGKVPTVHSFTSLFKNLCIKFPILPFILSLIWESLRPSVSVGLAKAAAVALVFLFAAIAHAQEDSQCTKTISLERSFNSSLLAQEKLSESHYAHCATTVPSGLPLKMADGKNFQTSQQSKFFDTPRVVSTSLNFSLRTFDVVNTCRGFADHTLVEDYLPAKTCGGVAAISYGFAFGSLGAERLLYKHHRKLARIPQWLSIGGAACGLAYTLAHGGVR